VVHGCYPAICASFRGDTCVAPCMIKAGKIEVLIPAGTDSVTLFRP